LPPNFTRKYLLNLGKSPRGKFYTAKRKFKIIARKISFKFPKKSPKFAKIYYNYRIKFKE